MHRKSLKGARNALFSLYLNVNSPFASSSNSAVSRTPLSAHTGNLDVVIFFFSFCGKFGWNLTSILSFLERKEKRIEDERVPTLGDGSRQSPSLVGPAQATKKGWGTGVAGEKQATPRDVVCPTAGTGCSPRQQFSPGSLVDASQLSITRFVCLCCFRTRSSLGKPTCKHHRGIFFSYLFIKL